MKEKKICILSFSPIQWDGRVLRQIEAASTEYLVDVYGYGEWVPPWQNVNFYDVGPKHTSSIRSAMQGLMLLLGYFFPRIWIHTYWFRLSHQRARNMMRGKRYDLIHAHDLNAVPLAVEAAYNTSTKVIFDAHEFSPGQRTDTFVGRLRSPYAAYLLKNNREGVHKVIAVSSGVADLYKKFMGWESEVIINAPRYVPTQLCRTDIGNIRLVHHGAAKSQRGIEVIIESMQYLDKRFTLDLFLFAEGGEDRKYISQLMKIGSRNKPSRIRFKPAIQPAEIVEELKNFDIGIFVFPLNSPNHLAALPNKLFEFIMAGLAVVISPSNDIEKIVQKYNLGILTDTSNPKVLAFILNDLDIGTIDGFKGNSLRAARDLNGEVEMQKLKRIYRDLLKMG